MHGHALCFSSMSLLVSELPRFVRWRLLSSDGRLKHHLVSSVFLEATANIRDTRDPLNIETDL